MERGNDRRPLVLEPGIQHYAWGDRRFIPDLLGVPNDEGIPYAELWLGAHPRLPSRARSGGTVTPLDVVLAESPQILGVNVMRRFGHLPYLLKVIAAAEPLSIQAHPTKRQAEAGFARETAAGIPLDARERNYKDDNHKPELIVAVTNFFALCGFRPLEEIASLLETTPELSALIADFEGTPAGLRALFERLMRLSEEATDAVLTPFVERLRRENGSSPFPETDHRRWVLRADEVFSKDGHRDPGLFAMLLLNLVPLRPGQALFLDAGTLHAYLEGVGVEVMANSDNVLRCGLTGKHVALEALLDTVRFESETPRALEARALDRTVERRYETPTAEFELHRLELERGQTHEVPSEDGATILIVLGAAEGSVARVTSDGQTVELARGGACLVPADTPSRIAATSQTLMFRVVVPSRHLDSEDRFVSAVRRNIQLARDLLARGETPAVIGTVSGSAAAQGFWQRQLDLARDAFHARAAVSFHEDLPVNQAFGVLLLWQRLREHVRGGGGALVAFVFGEGTRATPFTETDNGQKAAISTFVAESTLRGTRYLPMVELAMRYFVPVEQFLHRSGFDGIVVKWGDEIQVPTRDLSGSDPRFAGADVVRFVSMRRMTDDEARNKDWVGVDSGSRVTAFIPRRPLVDMERLADRGLIERGADGLRGGINLGSVALSRRVLDALLEEFTREVNDERADRSRRPDLDPQFFTAMTIAALDDPHQRRDARATALAESAAMRQLERDLPQVIERLRAVFERFEARHGRKASIVALDFGDQYWGDIGQHTKIHDFYAALREGGATGEIARALAGIDREPDENGNFLVGDTRLGAGLVVRDSVLVNAVIAGPGAIERSVLVGTRAGTVRAREAFDVLSTARELTLEPRAGTYKVVSAEAIHAAAGERWTTLFLHEPTANAAKAGPYGEVQVHVTESTDLRDRKATYDVPIAGNPLSFRAAHEAMAALDPEELERRRQAAQADVWAKIEW